MVRLYRELTEEARYGTRRNDGNPVVDADIDAALAAVVEARQTAEVQELCVLHGARKRGRTWEQIAELMGGESHPSLGRRHARSGTASVCGTEEAAPRRHHPARERRAP
ncbi:hypothetical protein [Nonomuraea sp. GTA35]|uniref:hypothetical protein n=1 Tax=Nonomuraea sp. GTA35 TaxID=1676746 RepID=UPI0035C10822